MVVIRDAPGNDTYTATDEAEIFVFSPRKAGENVIHGFDITEDRVLITGSLQGFKGSFFGGGWNASDEQTFGLVGWQSPQGIGTVQPVFSEPLPNPPPTGTFDWLIHS
jgi:hypothetical protein